jgi:hypothetical protein
MRDTKSKKASPGMGGAFFMRSGQSLVVRRPWLAIFTLSREPPCVSLKLAVIFGRLIKVQRFCVHGFRVQRFRALGSEVSRFIPLVIIIFR